jgi:purine nucleosidase
MSQRLVIDTDIGTDVDDLWTLAMLPSLSDLELLAVTVVYGDTECRARMAAAVLASMGIDVPVYRGCEATLTGKAVMWAGHEGGGVPGLADATYESGDAVDTLIDLAAAEPGTLNVLAIGPLTNIATAMRRDATFAGNLRRLYVMGGEFQIGRPEHNLASDASAAEIVFRSGVHTTIVPLDQTLRVALDQDDIDQIAAVHPIGPLMAEQARVFWKWLSARRPGLPDDRSCAHDPLALLAMVEPDWFTLTAMSVDVEPDGRVRGIVDDASPIQVVTDLDVDGAHEAILRLLGSEREAQARHPTP